MRNLLALEDVSREELLSLIDRADDFARGADSKALAGRRVALLFLEASTRTQLSFQIAARSLGAEVLDVSPAASSLTKGESIADTVRTVQALGASLFVVRAGVAGFAHRVAAAAAGAVVNAGDGMHEHPTQGLVDLLTLKQEFGRVEGLHVAIVGDIAHSRVARSNLAAHAVLGNPVTLVGPPGLVPGTLAGPQVRVRHDLDAVLAEVDVVMMLRIQKERMGSNHLPSVESYRRAFGMTVERIERMNNGTILMHPGPMNPGVEIDEASATHPRSRILKQVANGIPARRAALEWVVA